jgi:hypothetical protein
LTDRLARAEDLHAIHDWLVNRRDDNGRNANASALGRLSAIKRKHRNADTYRDLGRKGAAARWAKARAAQAAEASSEPPAP